jgi:serine/threonine protein phosphatase 1
MTSRSKHWVIGDVHGCAETLERLLHALLGASSPNDHLVFCGDLINRGPQILPTMERAWGLVEQGRATWLMGNHEADLVAALKRGTWTGEQALAGCDTYRQLGDRLCRSWLERLAGLPRAFWGEGWVATHAGFNPATWQPDLSIRAPFWQNYDGRFGDVVIGHTPVSEPRRIGQIVMIDTGACYGGRLTAYCPENRRMIAVPGPRQRLGPDPALLLERFSGRPC